MRFVRGIAGVVLGFVLFLGAIRLIPVPAQLLLSVSWTIAAAAACGFLTALIAGSHEFPWAATLGLLMIAASFLSMRQEGIAQPGWSQMTIAGCGPVSAMLGAAIRLLTKPRTGIPRG